MRIFITLFLISSLSFEAFATEDCPTCEDTGSTTASEMPTGPQMPPAQPQMPPARVPSRTVSNPTRYNPPPAGQQINGCEYGVSSDGMRCNPPPGACANGQNSDFGCNNETSDLEAMASCRAGNGNWDNNTKQCNYPPKPAPSPTPAQAGEKCKNGYLRADYEDGNCPEELPERPVAEERCKVPLEDGKCPKGKKMTQAEIEECNKVAPEMERLNNECGSKNSDAVEKCNSENNNGLRNASYDMNKMMNQLDGMSGGMLAASCNKLIQLTQAGAAAMTVYEGECRESRGECKSSCSGAARKFERYKYCNQTYEKYARTAADNSETCDELKVRESQAANGMARMLASAHSAKVCAQAFQGLPQNCFTNPNGPGCQANLQDCSTPEGSTALICRCKANPQDPACSVGGKPSGNSVVSGSGVTDSNHTYSDGKTLDVQAIMDSGTSLTPNGSAGANATGANGKAEEVGGKMGGQANVDKGAGGGGGPTSGGDGSGDYQGLNRNINAGYRSGGGGGGWGAGSGSSSGGSNSTKEANAGPQMPNLNKFRPNMPGVPGAPVRRDMAGITGPDGLMGPHANMWKQINNRYNYKFQQGQFLK